MSLTADLSGKTALVTGASSEGFGAHFAKLLAASGARVIAAARRTGPIEALVDAIRAAGGDARAEPLDVTDAGAVEALCDRTGAVDILVNNAGTTRNGPALDLSEEDWDVTLDTNLKGVWLLSTAMARWMREAGVSGSIVNIASITGLRQASWITPYAVSKAGVIQLTKQLALELARHGIRVNAIAPGYFKTDINRDFVESEQGQALIRRVPQRRLGEYRHLDGALLLLASDASEFMTGSVVTVDGGHLLSNL